MRGRRTMILGGGLLALLLVASACSSKSSTSSSAAGGGGTGYGSSSGGGYGSSGGAYGGGGYGSGSSSSSSAATPESSPSNTVDVSSKSTFEVEQDNFYFSPSTLQGTSGQQITLTIKNDGSSPHTFTIGSENISVTLQPGDQQDVKVTFPKSGSVAFYCEFHKSMGMTGELTVK